MGRIDRQFTVGVTTVVMGLCLLAVQAQTPERPADMAVVVRAAHDASVSGAEREKLVGKEYVGLVMVRSVRLIEDGSAIVEANAPADVAGKTPSVQLRFVTTRDNEGLNVLRRGLDFRFRARLSRFSGTTTAPVVEFTDLTIVAGGQGAPHR